MGPLATSHRSCCKIPIALPARDRDQARKLHPRAIQKMVPEQFSPVIDPKFSYRAEDVVATLERVCAKTGYPKTIRVDQGSEFISRDLDLWAYAKGVTLDFSRPGKPTDNAFIEAFNGRFRSECLNTHWFLTLADAREKMEDWLRYYNEDRPHGAIGNKPPILLQNPDRAASPRS